MSNILKKENRIVLVVAIFCLIFIGVIINYTYSFFAVEKTNSSIIAGEAESMKLDLTVVEKSSTNNGKLIPQLDEYITSAVKGRNGSCIDDNNNTVCQVYKITLKNSGSSSVYVNGELVLNKQNNPNLKWAILNNTDANVLTSPVLSGNIKTPEEKILTSNELFTAGQTKYYFIVVWISEKGQAQIDSGKFSGVVNFNNGSNDSSLALETLTSLGLDDEVRTNTLNFVEGSSEEDTGIYITEDDIGTSYYFRGNVTNNYVKFGKYTEDAWQTYNSSTGQSTYGTSCTSGGNITCTQIANANDDMYWRIVRINGDGTVRMIYAGTSAHDNGVARESIGISAYNKNYGVNAYVGYMYGTVGSSTYADTHANNNDSTIKTTIDNWYSKYLNENYSQYIADAIYCNDRKVVTDDLKYKAWWEDDTKIAGNGIGTSETMYGTWARMETEDNYYNLSAINPTLKCEQVNDRFTKIGSTIATIDNQGTNQKLTYPIGLLTADETIFAGGTWKENNNYYLYTNTWYWTMSPSGFYDGGADAFGVYVDGLAPYRHRVRGDGAVFPAISLSSNAITGGLGTAISPFTVLP